ncbi:MAG: hypothetical protein QXL16_01245 [Candidatus Micrarchaeaceae archaeon]
MDKKEFSKYLVEHGEPVGTVAAQSIGEPSTQEMLRTFHFAGIESTIATSGLPRMGEIVDARKEPSTKITYVFLEKEYASDFDKASKLTKKINEVKVKDVVRRAIENFSTKVIRFRTDPQKVKLEEMSVQEIAEKIKKAMKLAVKVNGNDILVKSKDKGVRGVRHTTVSIMEMTISGIEGVGKAVVQQDPKTKEFFILVLGNNIEKLMRIDGVDKSRIYSNDIFVMYKNFGIEAARNTILRELGELMKIQKISVDPRHLMLLADAMTASGTVKGVGRHGLSGEKSSVFARAAYEETVKHLIKAAAFGGVDKMLGVTENILVGKQIPIGTGVVKLAVSTKRIKSQ